MWFERRLVLAVALASATILLCAGCRPAPPAPMNGAGGGEDRELHTGPQGGQSSDGAGEASEPSRTRLWELTHDEPVADRPRAVGPPLLAEGALPSLAPLVERLTPTVVGVTTRTRRVGPHTPLPPGIPRPPGSPRDREEIGIGSGVLFDPEGLVLTNHHVIFDADTVEVRLADDRQFTAEVVGADPETDIAVLRLLNVEEELPAALLGRSDVLRVGDYVIAIGNPFGLSLTVTAGIVSATARVIGTSPFDDFLQTDAAINPGNSGGPLFDLEGRVVGINTAIVAPGEGIGFAVPVDLIRALLPQLVATGGVSRGYLGVVIQDLTPQLAQEMNLNVSRGARVVSVERRGPGDRAGVAAGDIIVEAGGEAVESAASLSRHVARLPPGRTIELTVIREGRTSRIRVELGERPKRPESAGHRR